MLLLQSYYIVIKNNQKPLYDTHMNGDGHSCDQAVNW